MYRSDFNSGHLVSLMIALLLLIKLTSAQDLQKNYKNKPEWIKMIGDPNANYYEAQKAYDTYWKYHEKPKGEEDELTETENGSSGKMTDKQKHEVEQKKKDHEKEMEHESNRRLSEQDLLKLEEKREMAYQCKRFEQWMRDVKPFVQNDGRILSPQEQMDIYNRQIEEQRKQNNLK